MAIALQLTSVTKSYGRRQSETAALSDVTLSVEAGETLAVLGASGSGKSSLLHVAAGLDRPSSGNVTLLGRDLNSMTESELAEHRRNKVGFVFQLLNLLPVLDVSKNIELSLVLNGVPKPARVSRVKELLEMAGLSGYHNFLPNQLSVGQQQRVAILRAIAHNPGVVFLDEPTSALDSHNAENLMAMLLNLNKITGTALVMATHDERITTGFSRLIRLRDGRIEEIRN